MSDGLKCRSVQDSRARREWRGLMDNDDDRAIARQVQIMTRMHFVLSDERASTDYESSDFPICRFNSQLYLWI